MRSRFLFLLSLIVIALSVRARAQDVDASAAGIASSTDRALLAGRGLVPAKFPTQDIFLTPKSSTILDTHKLGYDPRELNIRMTIEGVIDADKSGPEKNNQGYKVVAADALATTQLRIYENIPNSSNPSLRTDGELVKIYRITVSKVDVVTTVEQIRDLIGDVEGLQIRVSGDKIILDGEVLVPKQMRRVLNVLDMFKDNKNIRLLAETSPYAMQLLAEKMEEEIAGGKDKQRDINVRVVNGRFILDGAVDRLADRQAAEQICNMYLSDRFGLDAVAVPGAKYDARKIEGVAPECTVRVRIRQGNAKDPDPMIQVRVDFVTIDREYLKNFSFSWAPGISSTAGVEYSSDTGKFLSSLTATVRNLFPILNTAAEHGYARILKTVTLMVRDGDGDGKSPPQASFSETNTVRIPTTTVVNGVATQTTQEIAMTTRVAVLARSANQDRINLDIEADQTEPKGSGAGGAPNTLANSVKTSVVVASGESAALAGLAAERRSVGYVRDPAKAGDVDFSIFEFGKSQSFTDKRSQFVIFVTPEKLKEPSIGTDTLKRKFRLRR